MTEDGEVRIVERLEHTIGHLSLVHAIARVDRPDHEVETIEEGRIIVDASTRQDIGFDAFEHPEVDAFSGIPGIQHIDFVVLLQDRIARQTARVRVGLRVIGHAEIA